METDFGSVLKAIGFFASRPYARCNLAVVSGGSRSPARRDLRPDAVGWKSAHRVRQGARFDDRVRTPASIRSRR